MQTPDLAQLASVKSLRLRTRFIVDGDIAGLHRSPFHGFSTEFAEYRPYRIGESAAKIDWRVYARTEKPVVRLHIDETNLTARILLDASASMNYSSGTPFTKWGYGATLAAALSTILVRQRDAVGIALYDSEVRTIVEPASTPASLRRIFGTLENATPGTATNTAAGINHLARLLSRRGVVIIISDLFDDPVALASAFKHLRCKRQEVVVIRLLDPSERNFNLHGALELVDAESGRTVRMQGKLAASHFNTAFADHAQKMVTLCREVGAHLFTIYTDEPFAHAVMRIVNRKGA